MCEECAPVYCNRAPDEAAVVVSRQSTVFATAPSHFPPANHWAARELNWPAEMIETELLSKPSTAQERGEVRKQGERGKENPHGNVFSTPGTKELHIPTKQVFEARQIRDAERADPGMVAITSIPGRLAARSRSPPPEMPSDGRRAAARRG